jgi:hypothetical protein
MMVRKDFKAIAAIIRKYNIMTHDALDLHKMAEELASYFKSNNITFDKGKFMRDAGWYQE